MTDRPNELRDSEVVDREQIALGIEQGNIPSLLMLLAQLTGDRKWLAEPYAPCRAKGLDDNDEGGLAPEIRAEIRRAAKQAVFRWLEDGRVAIPSPSNDELARMLAVSMGEPVPVEYGEIVAFNMGLGRPDQQPPVTRRLKAIIIGAGVSGICAAINLDKIGVDWTIFEKNTEVGGTWWENRYPGCGVDTPNFTYTFSFASWDWPHYFPLQGEILKYIKTVSERFRIKERVEFGTRVEEARWVEDDQRWAVTVTSPDGRRRTEQADVVLSAVGVLNVPLKPIIPGVETFPGAVVHTAEWHDGLEVRGKRVAVVGNGASAMQIVPEIAPQVAQLTVFARSKQWAAPFPQFRKEVPPAVRYLMQHVPLYRQWYEQRLTWTFNDRIHSSLFKDPSWPEPAKALNAVNDGHRRFFTNYVKEELGDRQDLLEQVLPDFPPFAKRMLLDNGWYRTLRRPNVRLIPDRLARVEGSRVTSAGGECAEVDMIILATGFRAAEVLGSYEVIGRNGQRLKDAWETDNAAAYLGATIPGFPNFFVLLGPNVGSGHGGSMIRSIENQTHYVLDAIRQLANTGAGSIEVRPEVYEAYKQRIDEAHARMVWTHPGAENWYRNSRGRIVAITPWRNDDFWRMTRRADPNDYHFTPASAKAAPG